MNKLSAIITSVVFCAFIAAFFLLNIILPDKAFSQQENRYFSQKPEFSLSSLFSGDFTSDFEKYITDQFVGRDKWISIKALSELLSGKEENNGVFLCMPYDRIDKQQGRHDFRGSFLRQNGMLIEPLTEPDDGLIKKNIAAIGKLCENTDLPVYFALIPDKAELYADMLPKGTFNASQWEIIESLYGQTEAKTVDVHSALTEHKDEYIFYRTDHHWTTRGAYYGYEALAEVMGIETAHLPDGEQISSSFYGTNWSSSGFSWVRPDAIDQRVWPKDDVVVTNYPQGKPEEGVVYDYAALTEKDKYKVFFGGNTPLLEIRTGASNGPKLLILRDSYCDSLAPYLFENFSDITVLDLRYFRMSISQYIAEHDFDSVLVMYSLRNFCNDKSVFMAGR